jgi:hypothetical protein
MFFRINFFRNIYKGSLFVIFMKRSVFVLLGFLFLFSFVYASSETNVNFELDFDDNQTEDVQGGPSTAGVGFELDLDDEEVKTGENVNINSDDFVVGSGAGSQNKFVQAMNDSDFLLFGVVLVVVLLVVGVGVGIYFLIKGARG